VAETTETPQDQPVENPDETATTDTGAETTTTTSTETVEQNAPATTETTVTEETVEKAVKPETKRDEKTLASILKTYKQLGSQLKAAGLDLDDQTAAGDSAETTTVEKSLTTSDDSEMSEIKKSLGALTEIVTTLAEATPDRNSIPPVLRKSEETDPLSEMKKVEDPMERMRLAFAALHGQDGGLR
jgi:hypothetical protein